MSADERTPVFYRFAGVRSRKDSPSIAELEADGWEVEYVDPRYGTRLMRKEQPAQDHGPDTQEARA